MSTSSPEDTPANRSPLPDDETEKTTLDIYGPTSETPLASYDPDTHCWKMFGVISLWGDSPSLETLPPSGMTRSGALFRRPPWEPIINAIDSLLLHTPTAKANQMTPNLLGRGSGWWPTPTTQEVENPNAVWNENGRRIAENGNSHSMNLADAVKMWPTPQARDYKGASGKFLKTGIPEDLPAAVSAGGKLNPTWVEWLMGFPLGWTDLEP